MSAKISSSSGLFLKKLVARKKTLVNAALIKLAYVYHHYISVLSDGEIWLSREILRELNLPEKIMVGH